MDAVVVSTSAGRVEVHDSGGPGPVLLVLHGIPGDYRQGVTVLEDLGPTARVLLVSRPGYGRTPLSSGRTAEQQADLCAALLDALGIETAVVLGISGGGPAAYAFANRHPDRCTGLLLCCAVAAHVLEVPVGMRRLAAVPGAWRLLAWVGRVAARRRPPAVPDDLTASERAQLSDPAVSAALDRFLRDTPTWTRGVGLRNDCRQLVAAVEQPWCGQPVPTVVLHGEADEVVPVANAREHARLVPGASLEVLPDLGHALPLFARSLLTERLRGLLSSSPARPTPGTG